MEEASKLIMEQPKQCLKPNHPTIGISAADAATVSPTVDAVAADAAATGKFIGKHAKGLHDEN